MLLCNYFFLEKRYNIYLVLFISLFERNVMRLFLFNFILFFNVAYIFAETTPFDTPLKEGGETLITVELKKENVKILGGEDSFLVDGTYHYKVYIPPNYNKETDRKYCCLFITSPGGGAGLGNVSNWVREHEWIVVMLVEAKNGPWQPIISNFISAHDDAMQRLRIQPDLKFATGFSGGARASSFYTNFRTGFAGVILQAAGFSENSGKYLITAFTNKKSLTVYAIIGMQDSNFIEIQRLEKQLPEHTRKKLVSPPELKHSWAPEEEMVKALDWSLQQALSALTLTEENKDFLIRFREKQLLQAQSLPICLEKLKQLEDVLTFVKTNKLNNLGSYEDVQNKVANDIANLNKDEKIVNELNAQKIFFNAKKMEENLRQKEKDRKTLASRLNPIVQQYFMIVKKYPETEYGKKAQETIDSIKEEFPPVSKK